MSKHSTRNSRWVPVSPTKSVSAWGFVAKRPDKKWDAYITCLRRQPLDETHPGADRPWTQSMIYCGERRRLREAMMAVEQKRRSLTPTEDLRL